MIIQLFAYEVMDAWDCQIVAAETDGSRREWTQLAHDLVEGGAPGELASRTLRRMSNWLALVSVRQEDIERRNFRVKRPQM